MQATSHLNSFQLFGQLVLKRVNWRARNIIIPIATQSKITHAIFKRFQQKAYRRVKWRNQTASRLFFSHLTAIECKCVCM
jgi:hypothetical protein